MKTIITTALLLISTLSQAQEQKVSAFIYSDPVATIQDGLNIGGGAELICNNIYFKAQFFSFPDLRGKNYFDYGGAIGVNLDALQGKFNLFLGGKMFRIERDGRSFASYGIEGGFNYNIPNSKWYAGIQSSFDDRPDAGVWGFDEPTYYRASSFIKLGLNLK
jgi:hypothetical protein